MQPVLIISVVLIVLNIPLILGLIPPNAFYGFRTPKTRSSPEVWYPANRVSGIYLALAGAAIPVLALIVRAITGRSPEDSAVVLLIVLLGPIGVAIAASFVYLRKL